MINGHNQIDFTEKMQKCQDYIHALEEERGKIQVFQRELPLCLELVTQAIEACKQQLSGTTTEYNLNGQPECSEEETCSDVPVLEEFIPIKRASFHNSDSDEQESKKLKSTSDFSNNSKDGINGNIEPNDKNSKKLDWLRYVQLWNQTPDPPSKEESPRKVAVMEVKRNGSGGAFHPFKREKVIAGIEAVHTQERERVNVSVPPASTSSTAETGGSGGGGNKKEDKEGQSERKARRCWSPELHRRFLQALQQLGGSHLATPKQIRELMKVDGLTNDEVKSHLQKYRLHTRRPSPSIQNNNNNTQAPQFVVVGGIWVQPEYAAMASTANSGEASGGAAATSNGIYAPIAALPPPFQESSAAQKQRQQHKPSHSGDRESGSEGGRVRSHSPATSSSTHTTTASPSY